MEAIGLAQYIDIAIFRELALDIEHMEFSAH